MRASIRLLLGNRTPTQRAIALLRRLGSNTNLYIPGVGWVSGLQAGNYLESTGVTPGTVDQPVGRDLDAMGSFGGALYPASGWVIQSVDATINISDATVTISNSIGFGSGANLASATSALKTYRLSYTVSFSTPASGISFKLGGVTSTPRSVSGDFSEYVYATGVNAPVVFANGAGVSCVVSNISVREVTGIHATQTVAGSRPILRRGAVNLQAYSGAITAWSSTAAGTITGGQLDPLGGYTAQLFSGAGKNVYFTNTVAAGAVTFAFTLYSPVAGTLSLGGESGVGVLDVVTVAAGWGTYVVNKTIPANDGCAIILTGSLSSIVFYRAALFTGTLTAAQIQALGGIPLTTTAAASTALGPYWWDTTGGKSLTATFPAGYESVTVINAAKTGQVTTTAQNIVGAYSINSDTSGRIIVNPSSALSASELVLLQTFANRLAGL